LHQSKHLDHQEELASLQLVKEGEPQDEEGTKAI
jgi:hypothetical protein